MICDDMMCVKYGRIMWDIQTTYRNIRSILRSLLPRLPGVWIEWSTHGHPAACSKAIPPPRVLCPSLPYLRTGISLADASAQGDANTYLQIRRRPVLKHAKRTVCVPKRIKGLRGPWQKASSKGATVSVFYMFLQTTFPNTVVIVIIIIIVVVVVFFLFVNHQHHPHPPRVSFMGWGSEIILTQTRALLRNHEALALWLAYNPDHVL